MQQSVLNHIIYMFFQFDSKKSNELKVTNKRVHKSIYNIDKGAKRPNKVKKATENNSLSLLKVQPHYLHV